MLRQSVRRRRGAQCCQKARLRYTQLGLPGKKIEFDIEKSVTKNSIFGLDGLQKPQLAHGARLKSSGKVHLEPCDRQAPITELGKGLRMFEKKRRLQLFLLPLKNNKRNSNQNIEVNTWSFQSKEKKELSDLA
jgi:hypothetical protein